MIDETMQNNIPDQDSDASQTRINEKIDNPLRSRIIEKYKEGLQHIEIASQLKIKVKTITSIIRRFKNTGQIFKKNQRAPRVKKLSEDDKNAVKNLIDNNSDVTLKEIKADLEVSRGKIVSLTTISKVINDFCYTLKRINYVCKRRNDEANIQLRYEYCIKFTGFDLEKVVFVDESGFKLTMRRRMGRALIGERASKSVRQLNSQNISLCASLSLNKVINYETRRGAYNKWFFIGFINQLLDKLHENNFLGCFIIMDNCSIHKSTEVRDIIESRGHFLHFIPPYSPFLNPIEEVFSQWKANCLHGEIENEAVLFDRIFSGFNSITQENCRNYFAHMRTYIQRSLSREPIFD